MIEFRKEFKDSTKKKLLGYCAFTGTVSIGLFEFFSQVMANNLINIVSRIFKKELEMSVVLIGCFLLNMVMMVFVSIFNSDRRIFRFSLVLVSLGLNMLAFTLTCIMVIALSLYYSYLDKLVYKVLIPHIKETFLHPSNIHQPMVQSLNQWQSRLLDDLEISIPSYECRGYYRLLHTFWLWVLGGDFYWGESVFGSAL